METKMRWDRLICDRRFGHNADRAKAKGSSRSEFRRDFDRLVFSSPFRRLQNKTQVFPLPGSIFVHNRLTHSLEVASVGRSIADEVASRLRVRYGLEDWTHKLDSLGEIVAAACLAHDLGNPPFGHTGEKTIATWFSEGAGRDLQSELSLTQWTDLTRFDGNANAFRVLTHQFAGRRPGGFAMTYSTLASVVKYPYESTIATAQKFGFFSSEKESFRMIAEELGMIRVSAVGEPLRYARHPLVYIVEAADDICYEVMDIEDARKLGIISTEKAIDLLAGYFQNPRRQEILSEIETTDDANEKIAHLRSLAIGRLVECCVDAFVANEDAILDGSFRSTLVKSISRHEREAYNRCEALSWNSIYCAPDVVDIELAGHRIITYLLEKLVTAVRFPDLAYSRLLLSKVPGQYAVNDPDLFVRLQAVIDHITGMTDVYALDLFRKLNAMSLKINN